MLLAKVYKNLIDLQETEPMTSGSSNVYVTRFEFSDEWEGLERTAVFRATDGRGVDRAIISVLLDDSNECMVPWEVMTEPDDTVYFGAYGVMAGDVVLPTVWTDSGIMLEGVVTRAGVKPEAPTPDVYQQLLKRLNQLEVFKPNDYYTKVAADIKFATNQDLVTKYYTIGQVDDKFATKAALEACCDNVYTKEETDDKFTTKEEFDNIDLSEYYTKVETNNRFATKGQVEGVNAQLENYYTKTESNLNFATREEFDDSHYSKAEADERFMSKDSLDQATANTYSKLEADAKFPTKDDLKDSVDKLKDDLDIVAGDGLNEGVGSTFNLDHPVKPISTSQWNAMTDDEKSNSDAFYAVVDYDVEDAVETEQLVNFYIQQYLETATLTTAEVEDILGNGLPNGGRARADVDENEIVEQFKAFLESRILTIEELEAILV